MRLRRSDGTPPEALLLSLGLVPYPQAVLISRPPGEVRSPVSPCGLTGRPTVGGERCNGIVWWALRCSWSSARGAQPWSRFRCSRCMTARRPSLRRTLDAFRLVERAGFVRAGDERFYLLRPDGSHAVASGPASSRAELSRQPTRGCSEPGHEACIVVAIPRDRVIVRASPASSGWLLLRERPVITGHDVRFARPVVSEHAVLITLRPSGRRALAAGTRRMVRRAVAAGLLRAPGLLIVAGRRVVSVGALDVRELPNGLGGGDFVITTARDGLGPRVLARTINRAR